MVAGVCWFMVIPFEIQYRFSTTKSGFYAYFLALIEHVINGTLMQKRAFYYNRQLTLAGPPGGAARSTPGSFYT